MYSGDMSVLLPSTVEEINNFQNSIFVSQPPPYLKDTNKDFEDIPVERRFKREFSLPNGVENWNISNFDPYLNFDDNTPQSAYKVSSESLQNDRLVPEEGELRQRCGSFSSVSSSMDDKCLSYQSLGVKTFNTVCVDSGSTCISSDQAFMSPNPNRFKGLDAEETYQNLDNFFKQEPDLSVHPYVSSIPPLSPVGSPLNDTNLEYSVLSNFSASSNCSQDSFVEPIPGVKRSASDSMIGEDDILFSSSKRSCDSPIARGQYGESRRRNNATSKGCRKTRKEKQKEMEKRVTDLEREKEQLKLEVQLLEEMIQAHKLKLYAILQQKR